MAEEIRWFAIPEPLLVKVVHMLERPSFETMEIITLISNLPTVDPPENGHEHVIGFSADKNEE